MLSAFRFFCSGVSSLRNLRSYRESNRRKSRNRQTESSCREGAMKKALLYSLFVLVFISGCGANSAPIAVTLSTGATQALDQGQSVAITATVANDSAAKGVTWSLASGGQGTIANQTTTAVTYNAGSASGTAVITATSVTDTTKISTLTITVTAPPAITTTTLPPGTEGTAYSQAIAKTGGAGTVTFSISAGALPTGLTLSGAGTISGTPAGPNVTANFTVKVTDSSTMTPMTATQALSIAISLPAPPSITTTTLAAGVEGTAYSQPVVATGGLGALTLTISAGSLPAGLSMSAAGVITGTPTGPNGTANFTAMVTDHSNPAQSATKPLSILINLPPAPSISPTTLPGGNVGTPYTHTLAVTGGLGPFTWSVSSGTLPAGLSFNTTTAIISGIPTTQQANVAFTIQVTDSSNPQQSGSQVNSVTIGAPLPLSITTTSPLPQGNLSVVYSATISATGGIAPYTFSLDGTSSPLPASLGFSSGSNQGLISGTPTVVGTFTNIIVDVQDSQGTPATAQQTFTLTVLAPPSITLLSPASGPVGTPITITGTNFGTTQGSSTVTFNGISAGTATNWSSTSITVPVPAGATTGNVVVTVLSVASSGSPFTVTPSCTNNCTLSGTVTGPWVSGVTISLTGTASASTTTAANGTYSFANLATGSYTITPTLAGYNYTPTPPTIAISSNTVQDFVETSATSSFSISGTITYAGSKIGNTLISVSPCTGCGSVAGTSFTSAPSATGTSYIVRGLPATGSGGPGSYVVPAQIDTLGTGAPNESNPEGKSSTFTIPSSNVTGINITVVDRTPPSMPTTPTQFSVAPADTGAVVQYKLSQGTNNEERATSYNVYYGTDTNASNGVGSPKNFKAQGQGNNVFILKGFTNGPTYFKLTAVNVVGESVATTPFLVTLGPGTGLNTVSGVVTFPGTATGPLYVGVYGSSIYTQTFANPVSPVTYSFAGVPTGTYQNFAIIDMNNDGEIDAGDITDTNGHGNPPTITVSGNSTGNNLILTNPLATIGIPTNTQQTNGSNTITYGINVEISSGSNLPISMTLFSGKNVAVPYDLNADQHNSNYSPIYVNSVSPTVGDTYQFLVTFSDGTTQVLTGTVNAVLTSFAQNPAMQTTAPGSPSIPLLTWQAPASPPTSYTYSVGLNNASGSPQKNWYYSGGQNSNGIPSTQLNVLFNTDGNANPNSPLLSGTYQWWVTVQDNNRNSAQFMTTYMAP